MVIFLNEQKVTSLAKAAVLADEFMLTHKTVFSSPLRPDRVSISQTGRPDLGPTTFERSRGPPSPPRGTRECNYCHKTGHLISGCHFLKRKQQFSQRFQTPKGMGLIKGVSLSDIEMSQEDDVPDPCFKPFISKGFVSLTGDPKDQLPVQVLRDTGGSQSIIREGILPLTSRSSCGSSAVVQGVGMTLVAAPLHNVYIHSSLVKGFFKVAVLPALPIKGVDFILSNDLAGGKVKPVPEVIDSPDLSLDAEKSAEVPPEIFPACVVTRAQSKKYGEDLSDSFLATGQFLEDMTVSDRLPEEARSAGAGSPSNSSELVQLPATREEFMAAQFPEAIPLRKITAPVITKALLKFFSMFGLPKVVQTDQGTNFMSKVFARVLDTLGIKHVTSSPYHPESQGALERFHQTMKCMLRKHCHESHKDWDDGVPLVLFAAREAVQESLGFSPAELVFGHEVRGPLRVLKEHLIMPTKTVCSIPEYVAKLKDRLNRACSLAREALTSTQGNMKKRYDQKAVARLFQPGDKVLVLLPVPGSALSTKFAGPYVVDKKLGETNYVIQTPDRRRPTRVCHINMLKKYCTREDQSESSKAHQVETTVSPMASVSKVSSNEDEDELVMRSATPQGARLSNTEVLADLPNYLSHLPDIQGSDIQKLIFDFACLFNDTPSQTSVLAHDVVLTNPSPIKQRAYRVNPVKREVMKREVEYLLKNGFARPSSSPWTSPCVLDTKSDGSPRFCTDFRKVNAVTVPDAHPLPLIDDCIDEIGPAQFNVSALLIYDRLALLHLRPSLELILLPKLTSDNHTSSPPLYCGIFPPTCAGCLTESALDAGESVLVHWSLHASDVMALPLHAM
ncbi:uncharacterized protein [Pseudochaenichthys georgianus]|uniref:uncharacterized protein n=1 Tax=Pseudochaenichthys georgianus TaxID=52239 RepID=UPI0039C283DA